MAVYQKRDGELIQVQCDCEAGSGGGGSGSNIVISDAVDSNNSHTAASSKAVKMAYDHAGELLQEQLTNKESQLNVGIDSKINTYIKDKIDSGEIGSGGDIPVSTMTRINNNETRSITNENNISNLISEVNNLKISVGNAAGFNTRITELEVNQVSTQSSIENLQQTLQDYDNLKSQVEDNKSRLEELILGKDDSSSIADIEANVTKLRQDVDQNTVNISSVTDQSNQNKDDIEALSQLVEELPTSSDIDSLSIKINKNATDISLLQTAINDLSGGTFSGLNEAINQIRDDVTVANSNITNLTSDVVGLTSDVMDISNKTSDIESTLTSFKTTTDDNISLINEQISEINTKLDEGAVGSIDEDLLESKLEPINDKIDALDINVDTRILAAKSEVTTQLLGIESQINANVANISTNIHETISNVESNLANDISNLRLDIDNSNMQFDAINSIINSMNERIEELSNREWIISITEEEEQDIYSFARRLQDGGIITVSTDD